MKWRPREDFVASHYRLMPIRFSRLKNSEKYVISTESGEWDVLNWSDLATLLESPESLNEAVRNKMEGIGVLNPAATPIHIEPFAAAWRSRRRWIFEGPALHIFVVTLRCGHSCGYCQVSRRSTKASEFDMPLQVAISAVDRVFESPSTDVTIEFQGGEPLLNFDMIKFITELAINANRARGKNIRFVVTTTLHDLTAAMLVFFRENGFHISTSIDGPASLHNLNRPVPGRNAYERTIEGVQQVRQVLGHGSVAALTTITRASLKFPEAIVDEYIKLGFQSIFLRPLSPYGFAKRGIARLGYSMSEFLAFYDLAFTHIRELDKNGVHIDESYAAMLLTSMLSHHPHGYVDLRSPAGAGLGALVYNYDGRVYASDEARMLAEDSDLTFCLGTVDQRYEDLLLSPGMSRILEGAVAESLVGCSDCAYLPFCGADPVDHYARQADVQGIRPESDFCSRQMHMFELLVESWRGDDQALRAMLWRWVCSRLRQGAE